MKKTLIVSEFGTRTEIIEWFCKKLHAVNKKKYDVKIYGNLDTFSCEFEYISIPQKYRGYNRLSVCYCFAYWCLNNLEYDKIIHIDNDVLIKDIGFIDKMSEDLDKSYIVGIKESPIFTFLFGMKTEIFKNKTMSQLTAEMFDFGLGKHSSDVMRIFFRKNIKTLPHKIYDLGLENKFYIHYGGLQSGLEAAEEMLTNQTMNTSTSVRNKRCLNQLLRWLKEYKTDDIDNIYINELKRLVSKNVTPNVPKRRQFLEGLIKKLKTQQ
jgi:hypothetical protein